MSQSNSNSEPTMDEILASIRKIISEDQPEGEETHPNDLQAPEPELPPEPTAQEPLASDLGEPTPVAEVVGSVEEEPARVDVLSETIDAVEFDGELDVQEVNEGLSESYIDEAPVEANFISEGTRNALDQAFDQIEAEPEPAPAAPAKDGSIEAVFTRAVQDAFDPTLQAWVDDHGEEIVSGLAPLIREWMDENLPPLVEAAVTKEISRAVRSRRR